MTGAHRAGALLLLGGLLVLVPHLPDPGRVLRQAESTFSVARDWDDRIRLLESRGLAAESAGPDLEAMRGERRRLARAFDQLLAGLDSNALDPIDRTALRVMRVARAAWRRDDDPGIADPDPVAALADSILDRYTEAASAVVLGGDTVNRLEVLSRLPRTADPAGRRAEFLALQPVWASINGGGAPGSPYRRLVGLRHRAWGDSGSPVEKIGPAFGLTTPMLESWLTEALSAYRRLLPDSLTEPWDWYYLVGGASRRLGTATPDLPAMLAANRAFYRALGADPAGLSVHYDVAPRAGKYPVAFTDFGRRPRRSGVRTMPAEPWVFSSYGTGNFDNLVELLHETGHAVHLAAIRTRPAFLDWPDNDTFTEALADLPTMSVYEPSRQWALLGDSVPLASALLAKYGGIAFDMAWGLFEIRLYRLPTANPDSLWTDITTRYLGVRPHPELSWWAMRGQLIDAPGYLINYALGAFIVADLRQAIELRRGSSAWVDSTTYPWLSGELYRFGRSVPARIVLERFLGRSLRPDALLADLRRAGP